MADMEHGEGSSTPDVSGGSSDSKLEIKIKTLDSRIFSFQVDKDMVVSAFKEKVAGESGVPVGLQRLIFRGKVLKDDHLLSEYHVENGDTLHLVERQPQPTAGATSNSGGGTPSNGNAGQDFGAGLPRPRFGQISHSVVLGSLNLGEPGDAAGPDIGQVIGGILNSFGIGNLGGVTQPGGVAQPGGGVAQPGGVTQPGGEVAQPGGGTQPGVQASHGNENQGSGNNGASRNQGGNHSVPLQGLHGQFAPRGMQIPLGAGVPMPTLNSPIPDSLDTLIEFMNRMELALSQSGNQPNQSTASSDHQTATQLPRSNLGLPTVEALSIVLSQAQRLLNSHVVPALSHTAGRLDQEGGSTDQSIRGQLHTESAQLGVAMQHLGALFLELGRTMLTLRMGQSPAESFVNAGPAVYISSSGPNSIMAQPFPLQTSSLFGGGSGAPPNPMVMGPIGGMSRNVNIHIHTGGSLGAIIPRVVNGAHNREGTQGQSTSGTEPVNSGQAPGLSTSAPMRPAVVPVSGVMPPGTSVPHASPDTGPIPSIFAEINSQLSRLTPNLQTGNNDILSHLEGSNDQGQSAGGVGDGDRNSHQKDFPTSRSDVKETGDIKSNREISNSSESSSVPNRAQSLELPVTPNHANSPDSSSSGVPLGLGLGGLQQKKRVKQPKGQTMNSDNASTSLQSSGTLGSLRTASQTPPVEIADAMSQFLENPAMNNLLSGVAQQTGVGSPDMLRNMLLQFTQNPAMRNTMNQMAQRLDSDGIENMMAGLGGGGEGGGMDLSRIMQQMMPGMGGGGEGGGMDLSRMMQQMMPMVSQALGGGVSSAPPRITDSMENVLSGGSRSIREAGVNNDSQMDLGQVVERLENQSSSQEIFRSVGENVVHSLGDGHVLESAVNEICSEGGLAQEFMEMLKNDISSRFQGEMGS